MLPIFEQEGRRLSFLLEGDRVTGVQVENEREESWTVTVEVNGVKVIHINSLKGTYQYTIAKQNQFRLTATNPVWTVRVG